MSIADFLPVQFFELAFIFTFIFMPVLVFRGDIENYFFGLIVMYMCVRVLKRRKRTTLPADGKAVLVTGCDTGFGNLTARRLDTKGYTVFAGCLFPEGEGAKGLKDSCSEKLHVLPLDVTKDESVASAGQYVRENLGTSKLWAVVNNAGIYTIGDVELCPIENYMRAADVNLYGMIRVTQEFLPLIRHSQGRVVNMSSINGRYPWPVMSAYNASKYGIECVSDCLRIEMIKFGVKVVLIEPAIFGGSTSIHSKENISRHHEVIDRHWERLKPEVKDTYPKQYMKDQVDMIAELKDKIDAKSPDVVVDAVEEGVSSSAPLYRYVVHGGPFPVDPLAILGVVYPYLPEFVTDWVLSKLTGHYTRDLLYGKPASQSKSKED